MKVRVKKPWSTDVQEMTLEQYTCSKLDGSSQDQDASQDAARSLSNLMGAFGRLMQTLVEKEVLKPEEFGRIVCEYDPKLTVNRRGFIEEGKK